MQQEILKNAKVIGIEDVNYLNYMGYPIKGARVSFAAALPESDSCKGVKVHYQWISGEKLPNNIALGMYFDIVFNVDQSKNARYFDKLTRPSDLVEFEFSC